MIQCQTRIAMAEYLLSQGWATIGGRVEDYANAVESQGEDFTYQDIIDDYADLADEVWRGVLVFLNFGADAYYCEDELLKITQAH